MSFIDIVVPEKCDGSSVKTFARKHLGISARVFIGQKYRENGIMINGKRCKSIDILHSGDIFSMFLQNEQPHYEPVDIKIDILYEDENYIVIDKPFNMPIHPSPGHSKDTLLNGVAYHYKDTNAAFKPMYRLDKDTSGILVAGKNRLAVSSSIVTKSYYAVCEGKIEGSGTIDLPIRRCADSKIKREVGGNINCVTHWEAIKSDSSHTLVKIALETGRTHQIRVHFSHIGHPLAGDDLYGADTTYIKRQSLYIGDVQLKCSILGIDKVFNIKMPKDIREAFPILANGGL